MSLKAIKYDRIIIKFISKKDTEVSWYREGKKESSKTYDNHGFSYKYDKKLLFIDIYWALIKYSIFLDPHKILWSRQNYYSIYRDKEIKVHRDEVISPRSKAWTELGFRP